MLDLVNEDRNELLARHWRNVGHVDETIDQDELYRVLRLRSEDLKAYYADAEHRFEEWCAKNNQPLPQPGTFFYDPICPSWPVKYKATEASHKLCEESGEFRGHIT